MIRLWTFRWGKRNGIIRFRKRNSLNKTANYKFKSWE